MAFVYWIRHKNHTDFLTQGYIGVTVQKVERRFSQHVSKSKTGKLRIHCAIRKYGVENLVVSTLVIGSEDYAYTTERNLRPIDGTGWNTAAGGDNSSLGRIRKVRTEAHCKALSKSLTGRTFTLSHRTLISESKKKMHAGSPKTIGNGCNFNEAVWSIADKIFEDRNSGLSGREICDKHNIPNISKIHKMIYVHFKNGWNPNTDEHWLKQYRGECQ